MQFALLKAYIVQAHFLLNRLPFISFIVFMGKQSREHNTNIPLAVCGANVLTVCSVLEYITFKEEPIVLRVLRMISSTERNVYA